ncbi:uncharacterized protein LOC117168383 [Belonocnema kinseyi]|uniref:uncharacterized protein LOC117168383 n=1 Tax=Belonocnema kinseyi TaxID=2817044 RepID=UPI00143D7DE0|nr:uncharacterized protein LOC117168383 [Belonocnema kinseyi]
MNMKILTVTLFSTLAILLNSIESSQAWLGRGRASKIDVEPTVGLHFHSYVDTSNKIIPVTPGTKVTLGVRNLVGTDFIVGIVKDRVICPIMDAEGKQFIINMREHRKFVLTSARGIPYGHKPEHTIDAIINYPPAIDHY